METVKNTNIVVRLATLADVDELVVLNHSWYKTNLASLENGFLSVTFDSDFFEKAIQHTDVIVFDRQGKLLGYMLVNTVRPTEYVDDLRQRYFELRPSNRSAKIAFSRQTLTALELHGTGFYQDAHPICLKHFKTKYDILVSTINKANLRSIHANKKAGWEFFDTPHDFYVVELVL